MSSLDRPPRYRRFCPELGEAAFKSSKPDSGHHRLDHLAAREQEAYKPVVMSFEENPSGSRRKIDAERIKSSIRSNREEPQEVEPQAKDEDRNQSNKKSPSTHTRKKFTPQPFETSTRSNHKISDHQETSKELGGIVLPGPSSTNNAQSLDISKKPARRKFAPVLIETAKRSRKSGDSTSCPRSQDKTNVSPSNITPKPRSERPPEDTSSSSFDGGLRVPQLSCPAPNRQGSMYPHYTTRVNSRQHSFKVPDLEAIESSESDESMKPESPQDRFQSRLRQADGFSDVTRRSESADDKISGYLLAVAARTAEKQLREQEIAVFPNTDFHEPVAHYMDRDDSQEDSGGNDRLKLKHPTRRDSDEKLALRTMQRHGEQVHRKKRIQEPDSGSTKAAAFNIEFDSEAHQDTWIRADPPRDPPRDIIGGRQRDPDLAQMRKAANPPMLGEDIDFPRCPSPEYARFDVTQGSDFLRRSMCYLTNDVNTACNGLWIPRADMKQPPLQTPSIRAESSSKQLGSIGAGGLWGGCCTDVDSRLSLPPTGLVTPCRTPTREKDNPFNALGMTSAMDMVGFSNRTAQLPPSPPASNAGASLSPITSLSKPYRDDNDDDQECTLDFEFPDSFITQVYNYLSLGFPAIARDFDGELSKISGIEVEQLRMDDGMAEARGYVRLGEDEPSCLREGIEAGECRRWRALRMYCREWGRQMGVGEMGAGRKRRMEDPHRAWGLPGRKGSWAN